MSLRRDYKNATREDLISAYDLLDYAISVFQGEMFDIATRGLHANGCVFLDGRECICYKMAIPKAVRQVIMGRMVSESQLLAHKDPNQQEFKE